MNEPEIQKEEVVEEKAAVAEEAAVENAEMTFDQMLEESIKTIYNGDTVTGVVAAIGTTEITLDLPTKHSGYISVSEFTDDQPGVNINDLVKIGDEIQASVVRVNDVEGTVQLSKRRLDAAKSWSDVEAASEEGTVLEGKVSEENKGGVVINLKGIRVFIPASQTGLGREEPMANLLGKTVRFKVTEVNRARKRVVGSIRTVMMRERRERAEKIWAEIEQGKKYIGTVKSMTSYGAFVDIGGVDGMVHVSEISWSRIRKPEDVLSVGQEVEVYVISFDPEKKKISLGYRKAEDNPWTKFTDTYKEGDVATVKVVKFMPFGAFAEIVPGVDGLIHISQIADRRISKPDAVLTVGEEVQAKITAIDNEKQKVSLSIRALIEPEEAPVRERVEKKPEPQGDALVYEISATGEATGFAPEEDEVVED
jgi:4-hydroxy-3-methylbut-2-enyl diphosphate reductase